MPRTTCNTCKGDYDWAWEEAFDKFGFSDGDGQVMTGTVVKVLEEAGYRVRTFSWGLHNEVIVGITRNGAERIPANANVGYDNPRAYLPDEIVRLLDERLADQGEVVA